MTEGASLCQPCSDDSSCLGNNAACIDLDGSKYCGAGCTSAADCPPGYGCAYRQSRAQVMALTRSRVKAGASKSSLWPSEV